MQGRYSRNSLSDEVQATIGASKVLIAGLGGLGSGVLVTLAGLGVENFILLDGDVVEITNLNRQFIHRECDLGVKKVKSAARWLSDFNPSAKAETLDVRLSSNNYPLNFKPSLILDCFDNIEGSLILNELAKKFGVPFVHGGLDAYCGQVMAIVPSQTACLKCFLGSGSSENACPITSLAPVVNLISSIQAAEAMKILIGQKPACGELLRVNISTWELKSRSVPKNPACCP